MRKRYDPYKERYAWWAHPWLIALLGIEALIVGFAFIAAYSYAGLTSGLVLGMFFCVLPFMTVQYFKNVLIEPNYTIDEKIIDATHRELVRDRAQAKSDFEETEIAMLKGGKKIPVLETVRVDEKRRKVHPYYSAIEMTEIDPVSREFFVRIQVGHFDFENDPEISSRPQFLKAVVSIIRALSKETQLLPLLPFFSTFVVEVYSLFEDEQRRDNPYPFLSLTFPKESLPLLNGIVPDLSAMGDLRYNDGKPIEPHRGIAALSAQRGK
jgi:hypothetical protein